MPLFTSADLRRQLSAGAVHRGEEYWAYDKVRSFKCSDDGATVTGRVQGNAVKPYSVQIEIKPGRGRQPSIFGNCTCPVAYNCKHVAALLFAVLERDSEPAAELPAQPKKDKTRPALNPSVQVWLSQITGTAERTPATSPPRGERILYLLKLEKRGYGARTVVEPVVARPLANGGYGKEGPWNVGAQRRARFVSDADRDLLSWLEVLRAEQAGIGVAGYPLHGDTGAHVLARLVATGRCHWKSKDNPPLVPGERRTGVPSWQADLKGRQSLTCRTAPAVNAILPVSPPWYVDEADMRCGPLDTGLADGLAAQLFAAPQLAPEDAEPVHTALRALFGADSPALPATYGAGRTERPAPVPVLRLLQASVPVDYAHQWQVGARRLDLPFATLAFDYAGIQVAAGEDGEFRTRLENGGLLRIGRDAAAEQQAIDALSEHGFVPAAELPQLGTLPADLRHAFLLQDERDVDAALIQFSLEGLPALRTAGWRLQVDDVYPYRLAEAADEWFAEIGEDGSGMDWFTLELGITVDGRLVSLLPLLVDWLRRMRLEKRSTQHMAESDTIITRLPDGRLLQIAYARVRAVMSVLVELFDETPLDSDGRLKLERIQAGALAALGGELGAEPIWGGSAQLRDFVEKLRDFRSIHPVQTPKGLRAELRAYQRDGLNWLGFLREYQLGGILADDMGLGKTVQTLAHLQAEKEAGRLDRPALVVAPTSLIPNWRCEAERFTPGLKVLTLHGTARHDDFARIAAHDLILTTYALLPRDAAALGAHEYHAVILDEAQAIKNPKAKATQIAGGLKARQRLCLTGTPVENHLGELWSLFHFLMPGLLGDQRRFARRYRKPIEKDGDADRRRALVRRLAPFMLRRLKEQVAAELPPKTEIVCPVSLEGPQRDLYESIRLTMDRRVQGEIERRGLARSQIVILDALLKLRQTCCDPRLLNLESARKVRQSAKLELLLGMVPELVEEGRRILLFSQFTNMLALIQPELEARALPYVVLTGSTRDRVTPIQRFQSGQCPLFLVSLKAGGTGLNLTAADTVIHYDPWWNPATERQATDRAHRIGQDKKVFVYKLIAQGTVEEKIATLQARKQALADGIYGDQDGGLPALTAEDLKMLLSEP